MHNVFVKLRLYLSGALAVWALLGQPVLCQFGVLAHACAVPEPCCPDEHEDHDDTTTSSCTCHGCVDDPCRTRALKDNRDGAAPDFAVHPPAAWHVLNDAQFSVAPRDAAFEDWLRHHRDRGDPTLDARNLPLLN